MGIYCGKMINCNTNRQYLSVFRLLSSFHHFQKLPKRSARWVIIKQESSLYYLLLHRQHTWLDSRACDEISIHSNWFSFDGYQICLVGTHNISNKHQLRRKKLNSSNFAHPPTSSSLVQSSLHLSVIFCFVDVISDIAN